LTAACTTNLCYNGGSCESVPGGGFRCICPTSFTGTRCEFASGKFYKSILKKYFIYFQGISGTTGSPGSIACQTNPCLNGGSCQSVPGGGYRCICSTSFTGTRCEFAGGNFYKPIEKIFHLFF
jgi:Notch-like protein